MALDAGTRLGPYEILGLLGAGGMGEVYRAREPRLNRDVAIKVMSAAAAADPDRMARFEREARVLASVNHPSIVGIYAVEADGDRPFIAMEYVDGQVLSDVIPSGGLPVERLTAIGAQIADAVATAHRHGIVHRDLKPANVMVGRRDQVKVLDFGLAKSSGPTLEGLGTQATAEGLSAEGQILGTVAYMSPEQADGRAVDHRSDIFSLGVVLYEMGCGERPFKGDTSLSLLSAILRDTPTELSEVNPRIPRDLTRMVRRCLAKDPDARYQSAADLRSDLDDLRQSLSSPAAAVHAPSPQRRPAWVRYLGPIVAVLALAALAVAAWPPAAPSALPGLSMTFARLTLRDGVALEPVISPDGKWLAYVATTGGNQDIYLQSTTGQTAINLTKDSAAADRMPAFSPNGELIAFQSDRDGGGLFVMGRTGESVRRVAQAGFHPAWFPDGKRLVYASQTFAIPEARGSGVSELWTADVGGGQPRRIFHGDAMQPRVSPHGTRIAFWAVQVSPDGAAFVDPNRDIWTIAADGSNPVRVTSEAATDWNPVWAPGGDALWFLSNRSGLMNLWRVAIDEASGETRGLPEPMTAPSPYVRHFSLSADGRTGTFANLSTVNNLARVPFDARSASVTGPVEALTNGPRDFVSLDVNPVNGDVVLMNSQTQQEDLLIADGNGLRHLVNDPFRDRNPRWMPDGRRVLFYSDRADSNYEVFSVDRDGGGLRQLTTTGGKRYYPIPSPDGRKILASDIMRLELFLYDTENLDQPPERLPALPQELSGNNLIPLDWSADGRTVLGSSNRFVWSYSFESGTYAKVAESGGGGFTGQWIDADRVLINRRGVLLAVSSRTGAEREVLALAGENIGTARLSPDRKFLYFLHGTSSGDIWAVHFDPAPLSGRE